MSENIYGGIIIPSSPFIFDKYYDNYTAAAAAAASDGIMYGRYVLVAYSQSLFDYAKRCELEATGFSSTIPEEQLYRNNFETDNFVSYDRVVLKKIVKNNQAKYEQVCCLHPLSGNEYSDDVMSVVAKFNALNITNGEGSGSLKQNENLAKGIGAIALGSETEANAKYSISMGLDTQSNYPNEVVLGVRNKVPYYNEDIDNNQQLQPLLEIGVSDSIQEDGFTGLMLNTTNSIIHSRFLSNNSNKIKLIRGWRAANQGTIETGPSNTTITFVPIGDIDLLLNPEDGKLQYNNCYAVGNYRTILDEQCVLSVNTSTRETTITITIPTELSENFSIIGIYIDSLKDTAPDILYGTNNIMSGKITYHSLGDCARAFGNGTLAQGQFSHAEGGMTRAYGHAAHSEGASSYAAGDYSHAEGNSACAIGAYSHAEGGRTRAEGVGSFAAGYETTATGDYSVAMGVGTITKKPYSVAIGQYNTGECTDAYFEIGIGTKKEPKTGFYVSRNGLAYLPEATVENIDTSSIKTLTTKEYVQSYSISKLKCSDYIIARGYPTVSVWYNPDMTKQTEEHRVISTSAQVDLTVYHSRYCFVQCNIELTWNKLAVGGGGGHYVVFDIDLPFLTDCRFAMVQANHWGYSHCYTTIPSDLNNQTVRVHCWENNIFYGGAYGNLPQITSYPCNFYIECWGTTN